MWPNLKFDPINLWNVPHMFKERTIVDKILDEELRYYIKMGRYATTLYIGKKEKLKLFLEFGVENRQYVNGLLIVLVDRDNYLRVG
jgi:hypothetical protein